MGELESLKEQRKELNRQIKVIEDDVKEKARQLDLKQNYVKIECERCNGDGEIQMGGADIMSDPPYEEICDECSGKGYLEKRKYKKED